ncbi:hypothetical protein EVG20_g10410 [Dentipellis fragilis]|uniref:Uncharacterized protein n=1 Tax=Dentipellis fragilis TaxID=205917 RepID=A0A4Y9XUF5_9AGAM|nr:hypothetical protein EVG20_g10410 [Dentipellis fragilis]
MYASGPENSDGPDQAWSILLEDHPELVGRLVSCCTSKSFGKIYSLGYLRSTISEHSEISLDEWRDDQTPYNVKCWNREFRGDSADLLYKILKSYSEEPSASARFAFFVQSSGTGKSLSDSSSEAYPPLEDEEFLGWIMKVLSQADRRKRYHAFLVGLLVITKGRLVEIQKANPEVMETASEIERAPSQYSLPAAAEDLWAFLDPTKLCKGPLFVISFDGASSLTQPIRGEFDSRFPELCDALRSLARFPFFSVFLSTDPNIPPSCPFPPITETGFDEFADRAADDGSWSLQRLASTYQITHLGRSLFPTRYDNIDSLYRRDVVGLACDKLLASSFLPSRRELTDMQKLACLSVRLCLEFRAARWEARDKERKLVEHHMRICLSASARLEDMVTITPSEPLLAEAARLCMPRRDAPGALLQHIDESYVCAGERGELVASLLVLSARDAAVQVRTQHLPPLPGRGATITTTIANGTKGPPLSAQYPAKYRTPEDRTRPLGEAFEGAAVWFNHFVRVGDMGVVDQAYLWMYLLRGAALVCPNNQRGVDLIIPVLFHNALRRENISSILIQVKNDPSFTDAVRPNLFDLMDPFDVGVFPRDIDIGIGSAERLPVIRMVFALASETPLVSSHDEPVEDTDEGEGEDAGKAASTAYDIWCAGVTDKTFKVVPEGEAYKYQTLVPRAGNSRKLWATTASLVDHQPPHPHGTTAASRPQHGRRLAVNVERFTFAVLLSICNKIVTKDEHRGLGWSWPAVKSFSMPDIQDLLSRSKSSRNARTSMGKKYVNDLVATVFIIPRHIAKKSQSITVKRPLLLLIFSDGPPYAAGTLVLDADGYGHTLAHQLLYPGMHQSDIRCLAFYLCGQDVGQNLIVTGINHGRIESPAAVLGLFLGDVEGRRFWRKTGKDSRSSDLQVSRGQHPWRQASIDVVYLDRQSLDTTSSLDNYFSNDRIEKPLDRVVLRTVGDHLLGDCEFDLELVNSLRAAVLADHCLQVLLVESGSRVEPCYRCLFMDLDRARMTDKGRFERAPTYVMEEIQRLQTTYTEITVTLEGALSETVVQFMAIELLNAGVNSVPGVVYQPHHSLESILYVLGYVVMTRTNRRLAENSCLTVDQRDLWLDTVAQAFGYTHFDDIDSSHVDDIRNSRKGLNLLMFHHEARVGRHIKVILESLISQPMRDLLNSARALVASQTAFWILGGERTPMTYDKVLSILDHTISAMQ